MQEEMPLTEVTVLVKVLFSFCNLIVDVAFGHFWLRIFDRQLLNRRDELGLVGSRWSLSWFETGACMDWRCMFLRLNQLNGVWRECLLFDVSERTNTDLSGDNLRFWTVNQLLMDIGNVGLQISSRFEGLLRTDMLDRLASFVG